MDTKAQKRKRRAEKVRQKLLYQSARIKYRKSYPRFEYEDANNAPPSFVEAVKLAIRQINFDDPDQFTTQEREHSTRREMRNKCGQLIFSTIGPTALAQWLPYYNFDIVFAGSKIVIKFDGLRQTPSTGGMIYHSKFKPFIMQGSKKYYVGWQKHAVDQTCKRLGYDISSFADARVAFAVFNNTKYFEHPLLADGSVALSFFARISEADAAWVIEKIIGRKTCSAYHYYWRIGYCPVSFEKGFISAKTLLLPGYRKTPENRLLYSSKIDPKEKSEKLLLAESQDFTVLTEASLELTKWYHQNGIKQIIESNDHFHFK